MNTVPTLSDTKRRFYTQHNRPIGSIYRRFLEEIMVEMHLLWVNQTFVYDAIYALGVVTTFDRFMEGYKPTPDVTSIFEALCVATGGQASRYRVDAESLSTLAQGLSLTDLQEALRGSDEDGTPKGPAPLVSLFSTIAQNKTFKYSRLFAIGLTNLLRMVDPELLDNKEGFMKAIDTFAEGLGLPAEK